MTNNLKDKLKGYISGYQKVNAISDEERKSKSKADIFEALQRNFLYAIQNSEKSTTSGFVEMYKILLRNKV